MHFETDCHFKSKTIFLTIQSKFVNKGQFETNTFYIHVFESDLNKGSLDAKVNYLYNTTIVLKHIWYQIFIDNSFCIFPIIGK